MTLPIRKPNRLKKFDYSQNGAYFITICVQGRQNLFWDNSSGTDIVLSEYGLAAEKAARDISVYYPTISVIKYVIMPNHVHLLLLFEAKSPNLATVINQFKGRVSKQIGFSCWQKLYHDHVVRDEADYMKIWRYIDQNPTKWNDDCFYEPEPTP